MGNIKIPPAPFTAPSVHLWIVVLSMAESTCCLVSYLVNMPIKNKKNGYGWLWMVTDGYGWLCSVIPYQFQYNPPRKTHPPHYSPRSSRAQPAGQHTCHQKIAVTQALVTKNGHGIGRTFQVILPRLFHTKKTPKKNIISKQKKLRPGDTHPSKIL